MKITHIVFPLVLLCAGCSDRAGDAPATTEAAARPEPVQIQEAPSESPAEPAPAMQTPSDLYARLPDASLVFDFDFVPRSDQVVTAEDGSVRRGISLEYLEPSDRGIRESLDATLAAAGYEAELDWQPGKNGGASRRFAKADTEALIITVVPDTDAPSAGGVIWIGWGVEPASGG